MLAVTVFVLWLIGFGIVWGFCDGSDAEGWQAFGYIVFSCLSFIVIPMIVFLIVCFMVAHQGSKIGRWISNNIDNIVNW
jgi:large-conductance mechanosensitive channel